MCGLHRLSIVLVLLTTTISHGQTDTKMDDSPIKNDVCKKNAEYTREEVEKHVKPDDVWIIYNRKVYDMTPFYPMHPGGEALLKKAGKDVTVVLHTIPAHATAFKTIEKKLEENCIGTLKY